MKELAVGYAAVISALLYLIGYLYLTGYYDYFGISVREINFGIQEVLAHAFPIVKAEFFYLLVFTLVGISIIAPICVVFYADIAKQPNSRITFATSLVIMSTSALWLLVLTDGASELGRLHAKTAAPDKRAVYLTSGTEDASIFEDATGDSDLTFRLIAASDSTLFVLGEKPLLETRSQEERSALWVIRLPRAAYSAISTYSESVRKLPSP